MKNALRPTDLLGRWRDDQFLGILNGCREDFLGTVAQRLKATVTGSGIQRWGDRLCLAVSIGWTGVIPGDTVDAMVERAESALKNAMMALFIVLWLMNSSKQVQEAVGGYFKDPTGTSKMVGTDMQGAGESFALSREDMPKLKKELQKSNPTHRQF